MQNDVLEMIQLADEEQGGLKKLLVKKINELKQAYQDIAKLQECYLIQEQIICGLEADTKAKDDQLDLFITQV